jgi:GrpB-like predicted nucleotidyltransferase (UPF0157 family)
MPPQPEPWVDEPNLVVAYDLNWPARFEKERAALAGAIGEWIVGDIHHIGSTAVPGLDAKPIIDILVGVEDLETSRACFERRDRLRSNPEAAREYAELKHRLAVQFELDREAYTDAKAEFIRRVLGGA